MPRLTASCQEIVRTIRYTNMWTYNKIVLHGDFCEGTYSKFSKMYSVKLHDNDK